MTVTDTARADWLEWRRGGIGASDVAAILGISPWASAWSVWAEKVGLLADDDNEALEAGRWLELAIAPWFAARTGLFVVGEQTWRENRAQSRHRCTVDGFVSESRHAADDFTISDPTGVLDVLGVLEIKTEAFGQRWETIPEHYQAQGQWQLHVTDLEHVWFATLHERRLEIYELARDQADIDLTVERVDAFWRDHVLTGEPPEADGSEATARALASVYPRHTPGKAVAVDPVNVERWLRAKAAATDAAERVRARSNELRAELAGAEEGTVDGRRVVSLRSQTRTTRCAHCQHSETSDPFRVLRVVKEATS
ncbi:MAG: YqaJ viral recombinase family protein [Acidimicrobiales bacterium]